MKEKPMARDITERTTLVIGGTGKTGRRVAERLATRGRAVRVGSRSGAPGFDWEDRGTWGPALDGVDAVYVTYYPDLLMPEAPERIGALATLAVSRGVRRLVLLSGRGEPGAERCEEALKAAGGDWTILCASWFMQNFSESVLAEPILAGEVALPVGSVPEPFIDADDIADAAVAALEDDRHVGATYEITGPRLLTFADAVAEIAGALGREVRCVEITPEAFAAELSAAGLPDTLRAVLLELFTEILDGRNAYVTDALSRLTGRPARDFSTFVRDAVAAGAWRA
jgi:uncharacterized protein YbjT (DUF2867 family)